MLQTSDQMKFSSTCEIELHDFVILSAAQELQRQGCLKWKQRVAVIMVVGLPQHTCTKITIMTTTKHLSAEENAVIENSLGPWTQPKRDLENGQPT